MDVKTGLIILGEFIGLGAVIFCFQKEKALLAVERAIARNIKRSFYKKAEARELARRKRINAKAVYTPVKPPREKNEERAA